MKLEVAVRKSFQSFTFEADFTAEGDRVGIFGPSGSGKSTLVNMLAGLLSPDEGTIRLNGEILFDRSRRVDVPPEKRRVAVVFQHSHLFPHMSLEKNLLYGYRRAPRWERRIDPDALCRVLNLEHLKRRGVETLSGGERQRVALGRAVLASPRLILMDEPLNGLDEGLKFQIIPYLTSVFAEFGIPHLFISHSVNEMRLMTDRVLEFEKGRMVGECTSEELALRRMGKSHAGYINLLRLEKLGEGGGFPHYRWGAVQLHLPPRTGGGTMFELSSKDIILFKRHPEAISARNLLPCRVVGTFAIDGQVGVDLDCGGERLVAQVVRGAAEELGIVPGAELFAAVKASAFRELY